MFVKGFLLDGKIMGFRDFILSEGIKPSFVDYGTDFLNKEWLDIDDDFKITFLERNGDFFAVIYRNGFVGFATNYRDTKEQIIANMGKIRNIDQFLLKFHFNPTPYSNAMQIFNKIFYVIVEAIKQFEPDEITFDGWSKKLKEFYTDLVSNRFFTKTVEDLGFKYVGVTNKGGRDFFTFDRLK